MKTIKIYKTRRNILFICLAICFIIVVLYLITEDWNNPNWLLLSSLILNLFTFVIIHFSTYKNTKVVFFKDKIIYRLAGQKRDELIQVFENTEFSKDWKGIYINTGYNSSMISLDGINDKDAKRIFNELQDFYNKNS
ncbi:MAG: hypothetical protein HRT66_10680 [Flavobacteriaceae bacterium]|nr:hypothetical protein [Flavobacteriaceae bacterium]